MNIIVKRYGEPLCSCRPDTSWERENKDIWLPEFAREISIAPVVFTRIVKAGKCISEKFVSRYYEGVNFGALLYVGCKVAGSNNPVLSSCIDHTTLLPHPLYNTRVFENEDNEFILTQGDKPLFKQNCNTGLLQQIETAICEASQGISLRIGDYLAVELQTVRQIWHKADSDCASSLAVAQLKGTFCENLTMDYAIRF